MAFVFRPITVSQAFAISAWRYPRPYNIYNLEYPPPAEDIDYWLNPQNKVHAILNEGNILVAFCSFGLDGQVPGGDYSDEALDIGMGVRPDLTGQGNGNAFARAVCRYANSTFGANKLRVTIAHMNKRALRVWSKNGFESISTFLSDSTEMPFDILVNG